MKIIEINTADYGSTGKIMLQIANAVTECGHTAYTFSRKWKSNKNKKGSNNIYFGSYIENAIHRVAGTATGLTECFSYVGTSALVRKLKKIDPNIIHLHNLHGSYINLPKLFRYIKKHDIPVIWTLHDCWAFTGHCPYFTLAGCDKWKHGCSDCDQYKIYPKTLVDNSRRMYRMKKKWFAGVKDLTIVTPSEWLAGLVKQSFLKEYPVRVINNGIDLSVFKPTASDFRQKYSVGDKKIILGVAFGWGRRKGLDVFIELAKRLDREKYQIVLVGTDDNIDKQLPKSVISIHRTHSQTELAEIYTAADVFANPTREDNYPTVNMEAIACGTPVITFKTGGSPEMLDETCGVVVPCDDIDAMENEIIRICETKPYDVDACLNKANSFDMNQKYKLYVDLYEVSDGKR